MTETTTRAKSVKKPQDRKPVGDGKLYGEVRGEKFVIDREVFEDYEFLELTAKVDESPAYLPGLLRFVFGDDGHDRLKELARDEKSGRVKSQELMKLYHTLMKDMKQGN